MILTCPDCATSYSAEDDTIGPNGRTVRCSKCDATWFIEGEPISVPDEIVLRDLEQAEKMTLVGAGGSGARADEYTPPVQDSYESEPGAHVLLRRRKEDELRSRKLIWVRLIWGLMLLALLAAFGYAVSQRHQIVKKHPRTATLYKAVGLNVSNSGFAFEDVKSRNTLVDGKSVYVVNGTVRNLQKKASDVPMVELAFLDVAGKPITLWRVDIEARILDGGASAEFTADYPNPPLDAVSLRYRFVSENVNLP